MKTTLPHTTSGLPHTTTRLPPTSTELLHTSTTLPQASTHCPTLQQLSPKLQQLSPKLQHHCPTLQQSRLLHTTTKTTPSAHIHPPRPMVNLWLTDFSALTMADTGCWTHDERILFLVCVSRHSSICWMLIECAECRVIKKIGSASPS